MRSRRCFQGYYPSNPRLTPIKGGRRRGEYQTSLGIIIPETDSIVAICNFHDPATISVDSHAERKKKQLRHQKSTNGRVVPDALNFECKESQDSALSQNLTVGIRKRTSRPRQPRSNACSSYSSSLSACLSTPSGLKGGITVEEKTTSSRNSPLYMNGRSSMVHVKTKSPTRDASPDANPQRSLKSNAQARILVQTTRLEKDHRNVIELPYPTSFKSSESVEAKARVESFTFFKDGFSSFRYNYLLIHIAIMLADGLQGTHLYVLYEGYGYSVASLYCLGFVSGALTSPFIGPLVDKVGRKRSAMLYCALEIMINYLEQMPNFMGLIISRMMGGITTNLLFSVFETWLVTEHRRRGFAEEKLETILWDSVIASNLAAIVSGYIAHVLAEKFGPVGPFEGAVTCTAVALILVAIAWTENYGSDVPGTKSIRAYMGDAVHTIVSDSKISRIGVIQGLTEGSLQTFVFLWSPALRHFATKAPQGVLGLDKDGEPAYGLIFGAFMACGVAGGFSEHLARKAVTWCVSSPDVDELNKDTVAEVEGEGKVRPVAVEFLASLCYFICAGLLITPFILPEESPYSFSIALGAFLVYEFMVGLYMPCEGVIRSLYMPTESMCSLMTMLRVIVNVAVALGVVSTNFIPFSTAFAIVSGLVIVSASLQLSLVSEKEWQLFVDRVRTIGGISFLPKSDLK